MVQKSTLLLLAAALWTLPGLNILRVSCMLYGPCLSAGNLLLSAAVAACFGMMFYQVHQKHKARILGYREERKSALCVFDKKGWILLGFMIALGILFRRSGLVSNGVVAVFYGGLGTALTGAGLLFFRAFVRRRSEEKAAQRC